MSKLFGGLLILGGAVSFLAVEIASRRVEREILQELHGAMENMATAVRYQQMSLPDAIALQCKGEKSGHFFDEIMQQLHREISLQNAWISVFSNISGSYGKILCRLTFQGGDRTHILRQLENGAADLQKELEKLSKRQGEETKIVCASTLSAAVIMMILLW